MISCSWRYHICVTSGSLSIFSARRKRVTLNLMDLLRHKKMAAGRGFLDDQFLIAMPGMKDDRFTRSVIYICAHSDEGAMGLIINQTQQMLFPDLLVQLGIMNEQEAIRLPAHDRHGRHSARHLHRPRAASCADGARLFRLGRRPARKRDRREWLADLSGHAR